MAIKQASRQASRILKIRLSNFWNIRILVVSGRAGWRASRIPRVNRPTEFPDYILRRMRRMAMDSGPLWPVPTRCLKVDVFLFLWCIRIRCAILCEVLILTVNSILFLIDYNYFIIFGLLLFRLTLRSPT